MKNSERKQLIRLADSLPEIPLRLSGGKWVRQATNHRKRLLNAFENGGKSAVQKYVADFKDEYAAYQGMMKDMQEGNNNIIKL